MEITYKIGDLFNLLPEDGIKIIPHICNDVGGWGSGFVVPLGKKFPMSKNCYRDWHKHGVCHDVLGEKYFGLGEVQIVDCGNNVIVANMIAQHSTITRKPGSIPIRYWALAKCLQEIKKLSCRINATIHAPMFGSGLAGGDWDFIETLIQEAWTNANIPVTIYQLEQPTTLTDYIALVEKGGPDSEEAKDFLRTHGNDPRFLRQAKTVRKIWQWRLPPHKRK
jgi:hypothetical protein